MLAIMTKYHGASNYRGSRISATMTDGDWKRRVYVDYDHELSATGDAVYRKAANALCKKLTAEGFLYTKSEKMISGYTSTGYVFVFTPDALN